MHRLMLTSATYRQVSAAWQNEQSRARRSGQHAPLAAKPAPARSRVDSRHAFWPPAAQLNLQMGGRGIFPDAAAGSPLEASRGPATAGTTSRRQPSRPAAASTSSSSARSACRCSNRSTSASADSPAASRNVTTVAPQALILLNSDFMEQQSAATGRPGDPRPPSNDPQSQIAAAYRLALGREPTDRERGLARAFLERETDRWNKPT